MGLNTLADSPIPFLNQDVNMVRHDAVCVNMASAYFALHVFSENFTKRTEYLDEFPKVLRLFKYVLTIDAAYHNVVDTCGTYFSCFAWHSRNDLSPTIKYNECKGRHLFLNSQNFQTKSDIIQKIAIIPDSDLLYTQVPVPMTMTINLSFEIIVI